MINKLSYNVPTSVLNEAVYAASLTTDFKLTLNTPTGDFFYDSWVIKKEFKNTIWETILASLPYSIGEARLIRLRPESCYTIHADIDDRLHLNLTGNNIFLVDLSEDILHKILSDLHWYEMNAGKLHSAVNFGSKDRYQLVVRKLLLKNKLRDPINISIVARHTTNNSDRYLFDLYASPWLNYANKTGIISNFRTTNTSVYLTIEKDNISMLETMLQDYFTVLYVV